MCQYNTSAGHTLRNQPGEVSVVEAWPGLGSRQTYKSHTVPSGWWCEKRAAKGQQTECVSEIIINITVNGSCNYLEIHTNYLCLLFILLEINCKWMVIVISNIYIDI